MDWFKAALGFAATAYVNDAVLKPRQVGKLARDYCNRVRKPLLLIQDDTIAARLLGPPVKAEVASRLVFPLPYANKSFGAILAVGVLERQADPARVLMEWRRVADKVFVVVPSMWSPQAWLDPGNRWVFDPTLRRAVPVWTKSRSVRLLPVSDRRYGVGPWTPNSTSPNRTMTRPTTTAIPSPRPPSPDPSPEPSAAPWEMATPTSESSLDLLPENPISPDSSPSHESFNPYPSEDPSSAFVLDSGEGEDESGLSGSWNSVSSLTVVSGPEFDRS